MSYFNFNELTQLWRGKVVALAHAVYQAFCSLEDPEQFIYFRGHRHLYCRNRIFPVVEFLDMDPLDHYSAIGGQRDHTTMHCTHHINILFHDTAQIITFMTSSLLERGSLV